MKTIRTPYYLWRVRTEANHAGIGCRSV